MFRTLVEKGVDAAADENESNDVDRDFEVRVVFQPRGVLISGLIIRERDPDREGDEESRQSLDEKFE
jgi:hypothetical protein